MNYFLTTSSGGGWNFLRANETFMENFVFFYIEPSLRYATVLIAVYMINCIKKLELKYSFYDPIFEKVPVQNGLKLSRLSGYCKFIKK